MTPYLTPRLRKGTRLLPLLIALSLALTAGHAGAATIFDWGGNYVSANTPFTITPVTPGTPGQVYYPYSSTTPIGTAGGKLYGTFLLEEAEGTPAFGTDQLGYRGSSSVQTTIALGAVAGPNAMTMRGLYYFAREDFLVPGSAPITFDDNSTFSYRVSSSGGHSSMRQSRALVYALVDGEWNWYVSAKTNSGTTTVTIDSLGTSAWALYSFSEDAPLGLAPSGGASYSILGSAFEDIGALGIYFNYGRAAQVLPDESRGITFYVNHISLNAQVIPEPSVALLAGAGLVFLGIGWSRRRRMVAAR